MQEEEEEEWVAKTGRRKKGKAAGGGGGGHGGVVYTTLMQILFQLKFVCLPGERSYYLLLNEACMCACTSVFKGIC